MGVPVFAGLDEELRINCETEIIVPVDVIVWLLILLGAALTIGVKNKASSAIIVMIDPAVRVSFSIVVTDTLRCIES
jgi:hypothetical protein